MSGVDGPGAVPRRDLWRVAAGALLLQAFFNAERRQAVGFAAALAPLARRFPPGGERAEFLRRSLDNFNTNPAVAGPLIGAVARFEARAAAGDPGAAVQGAKLRGMLEGPLAGPGDLVLWRGARAGGGLLGSAAALAWGGFGPTLFLVAFNAVHLGLRVGGVFRGYARPEEVGRLARSPGIRAGIRLAGPAVVAGLAAAGGGLIVAVPGAGTAGLAALGAAAVGFLRLDRRGGHGMIGALGAIMFGLLLAEILA